MKSLTTMQTQLENTLKELVAIPSVTDNLAACEEIIAYTLSRVTRLGLHITRSDQNTVHPWFYATTHRTLTPDILLAAHLDVAPGSQGLFELTKRDGHLIGRGVYDMKFAAACYLEFLDAHASELHNLNIGILFTTDEEIGGDSMLDVLATGIRPGVVFIPDGGDNWKIEEQAKGFFGIQLVAEGKSAHGSRPWEGDNALHRIIDMTHILRREFPPKGPDDATLSITGVKGGSAVNQIAGSASATLDFRSFSAKDLADFKSRVFDLATSHRIEARVTQAGDPVSLDRQSTFTQPFLAVMKELFNKEPEFSRSYGGTDARYLVPHNIPSILVEPHGGGRHAENEWLQAEDLATYYELIARWVMFTNKKVTNHFEPVILEHTY